MRRELILLLVFTLPQAPPVIESLGASEADQRDRIEAAWDAAGIPAEPEVPTPSGGRCDLVTDRYAWEIDFAYKWAEGVGQASLYGPDLDRKSGLLLLVDDGDERFVARARIACRHAKVYLFLIPVEGAVPFPYRDAPATVQPTPRNTITLHTAPFECPPCRAFKSDCLETLEDRGWHVEIVTGGAYSYPTFEYRGRRWTGYTSAESFYATLRGMIE